MRRRDRLPRVIAVRPLRGRVIEVSFDDGVVRRHDVSHLNAGVFAQLRDDAFFRRVFVDEELGTVSWPGELDLDPLVLHGDYEPARR
jgi:hypothetical protein